MLSDFDIHAGTGRLAVLSQRPDASCCLSIRDLSSGNLICKVDSNLYPLSPRLAPDGRSVAFTGNDGRLHVYHLANRTTHTVLDAPQFRAAFCEWSPDGSRLGFSAYPAPLDVRHPPHICCLDLRQSQLTQLTHGTEAMDRFPKWSASGQWMAFHRQYLDQPDRPVRIQIVEVGSQRCIALPCAPESSCGLSRFCWTRDSSHLLLREGAGLRAIRLDIL